MVRVFLVAGIFILFFVFSSSLQAETFKWVDEDGGEHYSDQPLKNKDSEWVNDAEKTYFSYQPTQELKNGKAPGPPSGYASPKTSRLQKKAHSYGQATKGEISAPAASTEGSYTRQTSPPGTTASRTSTRQTSTPRTSRQASTPRNSTSQDSTIRTSSGRTTGGRDSSTSRTSSGRY